MNTAEKHGYIHYWALEALLYWDAIASHTKRVTVRHTVKREHC